MNSTPKSQLTSLPRNVWVLTLVSYFNDVSSEMLASLLPLFLFNVLGAPTSIIGLIEGIIETAAGLLKIFFGWLSDRLGERKWLAVAGYALSTLSKPLLFFADSWVWVLGARFGDRAGKGLRTAPRDALMADSVDEKSRGLAFGLHRAGDTAGAATGLVVALIVVWVTQRNSLELTRPTFNTLVLLNIIPATLAVLGLALGVREKRQKNASPPQPRSDTSSPRTQLDARFKLFLIIVVLFALGNSSDAFLILRAQTVGLPVLGVLGMMLTFNVIYALLSGPAGALSDKIGRRQLIVGGWCTYGLIYLGFARVTAGWQAWGLMAVYGIYYALTEGVARAYVADLVPTEQRGTAYGLFNAVIGLTALPASLMAGILWQGAFGWKGFGPAAPFYFGAALAILASALLIWSASAKPSG
jgi:MFS family permease